MKVKAIKFVIRMNKIKEVLKERVYKKAVLEHAKMVNKL
jgi:hypothetical protein